MKPFVLFLFLPACPKEHFSKRKNGKKESSNRVEMEVRRAISPEGCKRSAALCARSNEGVTSLAAFLPVSLENAEQAWLPLPVESSGDYFLSPAYDLINTRIHVNDTDFALDKGLFADDFSLPHLRKRAIETKKVFLNLGEGLALMKNVLKN